MGGRNRTADARISRPPLYRLSYTPIVHACRQVLSVHADIFARPKAYVKCKSMQLKDFYISGGKAPEFEYVLIHGHTGSTGRGSGAKLEFDHVERRQVGIDGADDLP